MRAATAALVLTGMLLLGAQAAVADAVVLALPHPPREGDRLVVAVTVGPIGHRRVEITTASGQRLGTISPFGVQAGHPGGTYLLPVPLDTAHDGTLALRLTIIGDGAPRSPTTEEVTGVRVTLTGP